MGEVLVRLLAFEHGLRSGTDFERVGCSESLSSQSLDGARSNPPAPKLRCVKIAFSRYSRRMRVPAA